MAIASPPARAEVSGISLSNVQVGIGGHYHVGRWTAFEADVEATSWPVQVTVITTDPDGSPVFQPCVPVSSSNGGAAHTKCLFKAGRLADGSDVDKRDAFKGSLRIRVDSPDATATFSLVSPAASSEDQFPVNSLTDAWTPKTQFWVVFGDSAGFQQAGDRINDRDSGSRQPVHVIAITADDLPTQAGALDSLSVLCVTGREDVPDETDAAIRRWVSRGGHLIVSVATQEEYAALPMSEWIPIRITGLSRLRDLSALTTQLPGSAPLRVNIVEALQYEFDHGETMATTLDGPLWARVPYGFGQVTVLGIDLSRRPLVGWESLPLLCEKLTGFRPVSNLARQGPERTQLSQTGISDLQTQLVSGLDQFPERERPTNWFAMGLIVLYLLVIGPLDYLLVHKLLKRPHWTWVTFPILVLLVAGGAAAMARQRHPDSTSSNQVDLVDIDVAGGLTRVQSWTSFTLPESGRYDVAAKVTPLLSELGHQDKLSTRISWSGLPESGFRGMYRTGGFDHWKAPYRFAPDREALVDLPVALWSSASVTAQLTSGSLSADQLVSAGLRSSGGQLLGTVTNRGRLPLIDWVIVHEGRAYVPQTRTSGAAGLQFRPGETLNLEDRSRVVPRVLQSYLTGVRRYTVSVRDKPGRDVVATRDTYDPLSRDCVDTLRMVSFYGAGGGDEFTSLTNDGLRFLDLSSLLPLDRAVLFCRVDTPAATFSLDNQPIEPTEHDTVLRIILPVEAE